MRVVSRRTEPRVLASYEILISPRALRRISLFAPAEMLTPEVSSIVEVDNGLSIASSAPPCRLFVPNAVVGYAEIRAHLAAIRPIESMKGLAALRRKLGHIGKEKTRDDAHGTILSTDPSLREELAILRAVSVSVPNAHLIRPRKLLGRAVLVWALIVVLFFALWQFLSPP
jgi:hypothetical protein